MKKYLFILFLLLNTNVYASGQQTLVTPDGKVLGTAANPLVVTGAGGGSVSDTAYGLGWNGDTTTAPSKNAVYDKIETISAGSLDFVVDSSSAGNVRYVGCSDDIATAVSAATAGDILQLGACTYSISSVITIDKALTLRGYSPEKTLIDMGASSIYGISVTANNVNLENFKITGTAPNVAHIRFTGAAGSVLTGGNIKSVKVESTSINSAGSVYGVTYIDASGTVDDLRIDMTNIGLGRLIGLAFIPSSTAETASNSYVNEYTCNLFNNNSSFSGETRCFFHWHNSADIATTDSTVYLYNPQLYCRYNTSAGGGKTECFQSQGPNAAPNPGVTGGTYNYVYGGVIDGYNSTTCAAANCRDARVEDYAFAEFYGTTLRSGYISTSNNGSVTKEGIIFAAGLQGTAPPANRNLSASNSISLVGALGGDNTQTGTKTGGTGGGFSMTGGDGAGATAATITGTGGNGGGFTVITGNGAAQTAATATTNIGGIGGGFNITAGDGGAASGASGTNTGGNGGKIRLCPGAGGIGTTTNGTAGYVLLGEDSSGTEVGWVGIQEDTRLGGSIFQVEGPDSSAGGDDFAALFYEGDITPEASAFDLTSTHAQVGIQGVATPGIRLKDTDGDFEGFMQLSSVGSLQLGTWTNNNLVVTLNSANVGAWLAATGTLGIGTTSPNASSLLDISSATGAVQYLSRSDTTATSADVIGSLQFYNNDSQLTTQNIFGKIEVTANNTISTDAAQGKMSFYTTGTTAGGSPVSRMAILADGGVIISSPATQTLAGGAGSTVTADACGTIKKIDSAGIVTTDTTNTFTAPAAANADCCMKVINVGANNITLDNNANFVSAGAADVVLGAGDTVMVCSTGASGKWYQIGATGNN